MQKRTKFQIRSDASKQRWVRDDKKEAFWRKHIESWAKSGQSKRGYCLEKELSESSFNAWKREIELRDREKAASVTITEVKVDSPVLARGPFVPLRVLPDASPQSRDEALTAVDGKAVEVRVPGGAVLILSQGSSVELAVEIFHALKEQK